MCSLDQLWCFYLVLDSGSVLYSKAHEKMFCHRIIPFFLIYKSSVYTKHLMLLMCTEFEKC